LKDNKLNLGDKRCAARKGAVPEVECRVGKGSVDGDGEVRNEIEGCKSRPQSSNPGCSLFMLSIAQRGWR